MKIKQYKMYALCICVNIHLKETQSQRQTTKVNLLEYLHLILALDHHRHTNTTHWQSVYQTTATARGPFVALSFCVHKLIWFGGGGLVQIVQFVLRAGS